MSSFGDDRQSEQIVGYVNVYSPENGFNENYLGSMDIYTTPKEAQDSGDENLQQNYRGIAKVVLISSRDHDDE